MKTYKEREREREREKKQRCKLSRAGLWRKQKFTERFLRIARGTRERKRYETRRERRNE